VWLGFSKNCQSSETSSTMTKPSASTLARRAQAAKNPKEAKRLRAQAAKMRREARMKGLPDREKIIARVKSGLDAATRHLGNVNLVRAASVDHTSLITGSGGTLGAGVSGERPGHGEIVGGRIAAIADSFAKLARKKGGIDAIQQQLSSFEANARYEGSAAAEERTRKAARESNEQWRKNIVSGFMARMHALETMYRGLPDTVIVDGVTLARVVDALAAAGYMPTGKR
jgi:hypothetical protein